MVVYILRRLYCLVWFCEPTILIVSCEMTLLQFSAVGDAQQRFENGDVFRIAKL